MVSLSLSLRESPSDLVCPPLQPKGSQKESAGDVVLSALTFLRAVPWRLSCQLWALSGQAPALHVGRLRSHDSGELEDSEDASLGCSVCDGGFRGSSGFWVTHGSPVMEKSDRASAS